MKTRRFLALSALVLMLRVHWNLGGKDASGILVGTATKTLGAWLMVRTDDGKIWSVDNDQVKTSEWVEVVAEKAKP